MDDSRIEFFKNASLTNKSFGHNKYQLNIQELERQMEELNKVIKIKDDEVTLFKNNLKDLNYQIQEKDAKIINISDELTCKIIEVDNITSKYNDSVNDNNSYVIQCNIEQTCLVHDKIELQQNINDKNINIDEISSKYNELKVKYHDNLNLLEKRSSDIYRLNTLNINYVDELNLYKDMNVSKEKEIEIIKKELDNVHDKAFVLKTLLNDKDIFLKHLTKQYTYEKPINTVNTDNTINTVNTGNTSQNEDQINCKATAIKMSYKRGI